MLGAGSFFHYAYLPALNRKASSLAVAGILTRDAAQFQAAQRGLRYVARRVTDSAALGGSGIRAALVLLPNHRHFQAVQQALADGLDVFCEKPLAVNVAEMLALQSLAQKSGRVLMVDFNQRYLDRNRVLQQIITEQRLGKITSVHAYHNQDLRRLPSFAALHRDRTGGGVLHNAGVHFINLFSHWFGAVTRVQAGFENRALPAECGEDTAHCQLWFRSGVTATLEASLANAVAATTYERVEFTGERGVITSDLKRGDILGRFNAQAPVKIPCRAEIISDSVFNALEHFAHCVQTRQNPETDALDAIRTMKIVEALTLSSRRGTGVNLEEIESHYAR